MNIRDVVGVNRRDNRAAVAEAVMLAIRGDISPAECMERVDESHDRLAEAYVRLGASTRVIVST